VATLQYGIYRFDFAPQKPSASMGIMKLSDWLKSKRMTQTELAERLGVSKSAVSKLVTGDRSPSLRLIKLIHEMTNGRVGLKDWQPSQKHKASAPCGEHNGG
jgi:transcriptional regulator with XRE-family HTH domain